MSSNKFSEVFITTPVVLPVIHVRDAAQALECAREAKDVGADGVWLIDHHPRLADFLRQVYQEIREELPALWTGLNFLRVPPLRAISAYLPGDSDGLWVDNLGIKPGGDTNEAEQILRSVREIWYPGLIFGSVASKYQDPVTDEDLPEMTRAACSQLSKAGVLTTSGLATGVPPSVEKIATMKKIALDYGCPLAVASGMTAENVGGFLPYVDVFMVGKYLDEDSESGLFIPGRLQKFLNAVKGR